MGTNPPLVKKNRKRAKGRLLQCYRICPYSTEAGFDARIPTGEQTAHATTSGQMSFDIRGGHGMGWVCLDDECPIFLGTATTAIDITARNFTISGGQYIDQSYTKPSPLCSGIRFWES
ncbi:MAG: hypothetical protein DRQ40_00450 [Gammaproteobacteria bacterium]|nr:MAG: hypothetical protein DRQ40_00450 [Gammaproteobacteria bacterium]